jgi:hypothetical protein
MKSPSDELLRFFETLTPAKYRELKRASVNAPRTAFVADRSDCERLVDALSNTMTFPARTVASRVAADARFHLTPH